MPPETGEATFLSFSQRLKGIFISPSTVLQDVVARPTFWGALFLLLAVEGAAAVLMLPKVQEFSRLAMERSGVTLPPESLKQAMLTIAVSTIVGTLLVAIVALLVKAALLKLYDQFTLGEGGFGEFFAVATWAAFPGALGALTRSLLIMMAPAKDLPRVQTSLALFLPYSVAPTNFWYLLLSRLDVFTIWSLVLLVLGSSYILKQKPWKVGIFIFGLWLAFVVLSALIGGQFGGNIPG